MRTRIAGSNRRSNVSAVIVLPLPLSPTTPSDWPCSTSNEIPSTAFTSPRRVRNGAPQVADLEQGRGHARRSPTSVKRRAIPLSANTARPTKRPGNTVAHQATVR